MGIRLCASCDLRFPILVVNAKVQFTACPVCLGATEHRHGMKLPADWKQRMFDAFDAARDAEHEATLEAEAREIAALPEAPTT